MIYFISIGGGSITKRLTHKEFVTKVYTLVGDEYTVTGTYTLSRNKVGITHNVCGTYWEPKANNFISGVRCPKCMSAVKTKTTARFREELLEASGGMYELRGSYVDFKTPTEVFCNVHNETFSNSPSNLLRRLSGCSGCYTDRQRAIQRKPYDTVDQELKDRHNGNIIRIGTYVNTHTAIEFKCLACGTVFTTEPNAVLRVSGCPTCSSPKGEHIIAELLDYFMVPYTTQQSFEGCVYRKPLYYDFYLESHNLLIEFDGEQHFRPIEFFGGEQAFEEQKTRDTIKDDYAVNNGIQLVRFKYSDTEEHIKNTLEKLIGVAT